MADKKKKKPIQTLEGLRYSEGYRGLGGVVSDWIGEQGRWLKQKKEMEARGWQFDKRSSKWRKGNQSAHQWAIIEDIDQRKERGPSDVRESIMAEVARPEKEQGDGTALAPGQRRGTGQYGGAARARENEAYQAEFDRKKKDWEKKTGAKWKYAYMPPEI